MQSAAKTYAPLRLQRGDEIMTFHLGSTVVLVFEPGRAELLPSIESGDPVRLGSPIARAL